MDSAGRVTAGREGAEAPVSWLRAAGRGFAGRCPACGRGGLFKSFLKVREHCATCGQELYHHQADDLPPYVVIFIVAGVLGLLGKNQIQRATPPVPEATVESVKRDVATVSERIKR